MLHSHPKKAATATRFSAWGQWIYLAMVLLGSAAFVVYLAITRFPPEAPAEPDQGPPAKRWDQVPFSGTRALNYLQQICDLGPRPSGSEGMRRQQELLEKHFQELGAKVSRQKFSVRHPRTGEPVEMSNLVVSWNPEAKERLLLAAHYDTRPFPDRDPARPQGTFVGANDGASGVAVLMELAHWMPKLGARYGVDFVLFDGEEFVFGETDPYFLGATHFAREYKSHPPGHRYKYGVLLDMVGDKDLQLLYEQHSLDWNDARPLALDVWKLARKMRVSEFIPRRGHLVRDDHLALRNTGGIPTIDIIDFDYPYWHTEGDVPDRCSAASLGKVGAVMHEWLRTAP